MLTFNVVLVYQGFLFRDFLWFCFLGFFFSIRPTDSMSGNAFDAKRNLEFAQQPNRHWLRVDGTKSWTGRSIKSAQLRPFRADHFWPLEGGGCMDFFWFGLEFLDNYGKLSTYPSSKPTLTLISHLGWNVGLGDGQVGTVLGPVLRSNQRKQTSHSVP